MKFFAYGSLMTKLPAIRSLPEYTILAQDSLLGYKRTFSVKSPYRFNPDTGIHSAVLNLEPCTKTEVFGAVIDVPEHCLHELYHREEGYEQVLCQLKSGEQAIAFIMSNYTHHPYAHGDELQEAYLTMCLEGARGLSREAYENFIDTTHIDHETVRDYLTKSSA